MYIVRIRANLGTCNWAMPMCLKLMVAKGMTMKKFGCTRFLIITNFL